MISGSHDNTVIIWDVKTCKFEQIISLFQKSIHSIALSHDGINLIVNDANRKLWFFKSEEGKMNFSQKTIVCKMSLNDKNEDVEKGFNLLIPESLSERLNDKHF